MNCGFNNKWKFTTPTAKRNEGRSKTLMPIFSNLPLVNKQTTETKKSSSYFLSDDLNSIFVFKIFIQLTKSTFPKSSCAYCNLSLKFYLTITFRNYFNYKFITFKIVPELRFIYSEICRILFVFQFGCYYSRTILGSVCLYKHFLSYRLQDCVLNGMCAN